MESGFIYIWRDRKHNRYYIGAHWGSEDDGYDCSSRWMRAAMKRRPNDFKRRILEYVYDREKLYDVEYKWLSMIKEEEVKERYYNLRITKFSHWSAYPESVKTVPQKISYKTKEAMQRDDVRQNYLEGIKTRDNKSSHEDVRRKRSDSMKATLATKGKWPLNDDLPDMTGTKRLWKDGKYKMTRENTEQYQQLRDEGWQTKRELLLDLVEKFRYEVDDRSSDLKAIARRMIGVGYLNEKDYYRYLKD